MEEQHAIRTRQLLGRRRETSIRDNGGVPSAFVRSACGSFLDSLVADRLTVELTLEDHTNALLGRDYIDALVPAVLRDMCLPTHLPQLLRTEGFKLRGGGVVGKRSEGRTLACRFRNPLVY